MDKLFEIKEKYAYEDYLELNKYHMIKSKKSKVTLVIIYLLLILIACISFYLKNYSYLLFSIVFAILYPLLMIITVKSVAKKSYETNKINKNITQTLTFYNDYFEVVSEIANSKIYYDKLYSINESKNSFFLFIAYNQAFIVKKSEIEDVVKFREFIQSKK